VTLNMDNNQSHSEAPVGAAPAASAAGGLSLSLPEDALIIVPVRNMVLFPGMILPLNIGRETSIAAAQAAVRAECPIGFLLQKDASAEIPEPADLYTVSTVAQVLRYVTAQDGIAVTVKADPVMPQVAGDHDELVQLFQNLVHNAIKYGREKGKVEISLGSSDNQVFAAIRDDGEGIAPNAIPRLTERFYRVDVKRSREKGGTGLGLAIVKHIISRHQGRLAIESRQGEGSTFTVFLPAARPEMAPKPALPEPVTEML